MSPHSKKMPNIGLSHFHLWKPLRVTKCRLWHGLQSARCTCIMESPMSQSVRPRSSGNRSQGVMVSISLKPGLPRSADSIIHVSSCSCSHSGHTGPRNLPTAESIWTAFLGDWTGTEFRMGFLYCHTYPHTYPAAHEVSQIRPVLGRSAVQHIDLLQCPTLKSMHVMH